MAPVTAHDPRAFTEALAARLKAERALRGLDQADVAEGATFSLRTYNRIEGGGGATLDQLVEISERFRLPLSELLALVESDIRRRESDSPAPQQRRARAGKVRTQAPSKPKVTVRQSD